MSEEGKFGAKGVREELGRLRRYSEGLKVKEVNKMFVKMVR